MTTSRSARLFEKELFPHMEALKTFAYHLTYNEADAEDLVQETYLKAHKFIENYDAGTNAKAWLFKILKNAYINEYRKKARRPQQVDIDDTSKHSEGGNQVADAHSDLRKDFFDDALGDEVTLALNTIPIEFRTIILLCDIENFSYEEIAKILDIPIGTVRSRLFRARNMLKNKLTSYAKNFGYTDYRGEKRTTFFEEEE